MMMIDQVRPALLSQVCEAELAAEDWTLTVATHEWTNPVDVAYRRPRNSIALYIPVPQSERTDSNIYDYRNGRGQIRLIHSGRTSTRLISPAFFCAAGIEMEGHGPGGRARSVYFDFDDSRVVQVLGEEPDWHTENLEAGLQLMGTPVVSLMQRMMEEVLNPGFASKALIEATGIEAIIMLLRHMRGSVPLPGCRGTLSRAQLDMVRGRVNAMDLPVPTVAEIAALCRMSDRNLLRLFKQTTGETVVTFIRRARLDRARELLADERVPLKEIAFRAGFSDHSGFTAAFRNATGETPSRFRARVQRHTARRKTLFSIAGPR